MFNCILLGARIIISSDVELDEDFLYMQNTIPIENNYIDYRKNSY
jgi:hypothetical protein